MITGRHGVDGAARLYRDFHQLEPTDVGAFRAGFAIPTHAVHVGEADTVYYCSDKLNPVTGADEGWIQYYHPHEPGVGAYRCDKPAAELGPMSPVPKRIRSAAALVRLGLCEGYRYIAWDGECIDAMSREPLPEWYATPDGRALLIVQDRRRVLALLWGGLLSVKPEGIVG